MRRAWLLVLGGCATLADAGGGDRNAPNAKAGPFRELRRDEVGVGHTAPYVLVDDARALRNACVVDRDGDPATLPVFAIAARHGSEGKGSAANELVRVDADDGRSFDAEPTVVLSAQAGSEGGTVDSPSALRVGDGVRLYYAAADGVHLAESDDGRAFSRVGESPVLGVATIGWDAGAVPKSPSVVADAGGGYLLYYEASGAIGEARSDDGVHFERAAAPVLMAEPEASAKLLAPDAVWSHSPLGRSILWLYVATETPDGLRTIDVAAREEGASAFVRAASPVFGMSSTLRPTEPSVVRFETFSLLFVTERAGKGASQTGPAIGCGVAPATLSLAPR